MRLELRLSTDPPLTDRERAHWIDTLLRLAGDLERRRDLGPLADLDEVFDGGCGDVDRKALWGEEFKGVYQIDLHAGPVVVGSRENFVHTEVLREGEVVVIRRSSPAAPERRAP